MPFLCLPDERTHSSSSFSFPYLSPTRVTGRGCVWGGGAPARRSGLARLATAALTFADRRSFPSRAEAHDGVEVRRSGGAAIRSWSHAGFGLDAGFCLAGAGYRART